MLHIASHTAHYKRLYHFGIFQATINSHYLVFYHILRTKKGMNKALALHPRYITVVLNNLNTVSGDG